MLLWDEAVAVMAMVRGAAGGHSFLPANTRRNHERQLSEWLQSKQKTMSSERLESRTARTPTPSYVQQLTEVSVAWVNVAASNLTLLPDNDT